MIGIGETKVLCTVTSRDEVPEFLEGKGSGWVTAEYGMLPGSTKERVARERGRGRTYEIQRLIGRSLRAVCDLTLIPEQTLYIDCDVLSADGGTRTAAITGAYVALSLAVKKLLAEQMIKKNPIYDQLAAVSCGIVSGRKILDLNYEEDSKAEVDMNVVMTKSGRFIEVQASAERKTFSKNDLDSLLLLAKKGIEELIREQARVLKARDRD
jgi:ribonuclease PH